MKLPVIIATLSLLVLTATAGAAEDACPVKSSRFEDMDQAVRDAPSCDAAMKLWDLCIDKFAAHLDLPDVVAEKCEAEAEKAGKKTERRAWNSLLMNERNGAMLCSAPSKHSATPTGRYISRSNPRS